MSDDRQRGISGWVAGIDPTAGRAVLGVCVFAYAVALWTI